VSTFINNAFIICVEFHSIVRLMRTVTVWWQRQ